MCNQVDSLDGVANELAVLLDDFLDAALFHVLGLVFLQVKDDLRTTTNELAVVRANGEAATG